MDLCHRHGEKQRKHTKFSPGLCAFVLGLGDILNFQIWNGRSKQQFKSQVSIWHFKSFEVFFFIKIQTSKYVNLMHINKNHSIVFNNMKNIWVFFVYWNAYITIYLKIYRNILNVLGNKWQIERCNPALVCGVCTQACTWIKKCNWD